MKIKIKKILPAISLVTITAFILYGCKKNTAIEAGNNTETNKEKIIEAAREKYGNITAPVIYQPHKNASYLFYIDENSVEKRIEYDAVATEATCGQYTCATATKAANLYITFTLEYIKWYYKCGTGHDLTAIWKVSVPFNLSEGHPLIGNTYSSGHMRIKDVNGNILATGGSNTFYKAGGNMQIVNEGPDPNCSSNTLYTVTYTWENIADTYFVGNEVDCYVVIYNDCSKTNYSIGAGYTQGLTYTNTSNVFTLPCDRIDQAFITLGTGINSCANVVGAYNLCTPPSGYPWVNEHQVEYRPVDNTSSDLWEDQSNSSVIQYGIVSGSGTPGTQAITMDACCDVIDLRDMKPNSGKWLVRYRNRHTGCSTPGSLGALWPGNYVTEVFNL